MKHHRNQEGQPMGQPETRPRPGTWPADQHASNLQVLHAKLEELTARYQLPVSALARILHVSSAWVAATLRRRSAKYSSEVNSHVQ